MDARTFFSGPDGKVTESNPAIASAAVQCRVSPAYLYLVVMGLKNPSPRLAADLEHATNGQVDRRAILPDFPWDAPVTRAA